MNKITNDTFECGLALIEKWRGDAYQTGDDVCTGLMTMVQGYNELVETVRYLMDRNAQATDDEFIYPRIKLIDREIPVDNVKLEPVIYQRPVILRSWEKHYMECPVCETTTELDDPVHSAQNVTCDNCGNTFRGIRRD